ncbi:hypothetical protein EST38_g13881 [Candolleomyces aberdarensis]|uniref:Reverse transcriptase domain-containing protein n=1 Tax=Candolleomyces aberdarensis TaxID=2316362 RepID=A0A4Q2D150_9AGAR|nr:hypothetical protein EST38_g13881 [Candolleomyces aberdarensis]
MDKLFIEVTRKGVVIIYMDDVLIFTKDLDTHCHITREVLQIMKDNNLSLKPEKCEWEKTEIEYLGHIISTDGVKMDPKKVQAIINWLTPKSKKELQQFLVLANYYRRFIDGFASLASPLNSLTGNTPCSNSTLSFPTDDDPFRVEADSSGFATGAVLSQKQNDIWRPITFLSRSLSEVKRNYEIHNREMLAIMRVLEEWKHHLKATPTPFKIHTDLKNLQYFMTAQKLNRRQARWSSELQDFSFTLHHKPGKSFIVPDSLSRRPDYDKGINNNTDITLLLNHHIRRLSIIPFSDHNLFLTRI